MATRLPIVYTDAYNISFFGIESYLHSFDSKKYGRVFNSLSKRFDFKLSDIHQPTKIHQEDLELVHTKAYLDSLNNSSSIAQITEIFVLGYLPNFLLQNIVLNPMKYAAQGTIDAAILALMNGWSINLGGGYHHAKPDHGEGFCVFADIPIAVKKLISSNKVKRVFIVDLDAHQGNGFVGLYSEINEDANGIQTVFYKNNEDIVVMDIYNKDVYPGDSFAKSFIEFNCPIPSKTSDKKYLSILNKTLPKAVKIAQPDIIFYNAGTDIYAEDPLGNLSVSASAIVGRDEEVFRVAATSKIPIVMVLSGGYTKESANIISQSIINLHDKGLINLTGSDSISM